MNDTINLDEIVPDNELEEEIIADLKSGRNKEVITRCPPEPSGYWHIAHAKAWTIDFDTAIKFGGKTYLRMDDTNPLKEEGEFADSYLSDLEWLGYKPEKLIYASEAYFEDIYKIAEQMIIDGKAYVCELSPEQVSATRGTLTEPGKDSPYRNRTPEENLKLFRDMRDGKFEDGKATLRAKIDMKHPNMNMRDPVMYRVLRAKHYRLGDKWCIYPMYDFAHPLEDALEGVTYSLCSKEFLDHRPIYDWFIENGWKKPYGPKQREFSRLTIENVLIGKRYLKQLVNEKYVSGWDDPRFPTLVGVRRRGYTAKALKDFVKSVGWGNVLEVTVPYSALEYYVREDLNKIATRAMVVINPLKVVITNGPEKPEEIELENNPNDENAGFHTALFSKEIYIEQEDFSLNPPPKYNRLVEGGIVRLKGAYIIKCNQVVYKENGEIDHLECEYIPNTKSGNDTSGIKCKGTIHFVSSENCFEIKVREFKNLIKAEYTNPAKALSDGVAISEILEPDSLIEKTALAENFLKNAKVEDKYQFMRTGYYCVDKDSTENQLIFNKTISLKDGYKPNK
ncbi:MAG: glutamine--tRNA ligase [Clostridiales bacterium]|nr:glutamine--tRNA ligase [Clostridiales bacterium]